MQFLSLSGGAIAGIAVGAVAFLLIVFGIWYVTSKNGLISLKNDVEESYSAMDVGMKKRYDLIPNLVATCKGYAKHESETFSNVARARNNAMSAVNPVDKISAERELNVTIRTMMSMVREQYPELKADRQFVNLSNQLEKLEEEIARSRKYYNAKVKMLNNKIEKFPSSFVAGKMRLERRPYFELDDISERIAPKVSFE